jgi:ferrochelatase
MGHRHKTLGVLLMAYGSPGSLDDVEAYYTHIRGGRTPASEHVAALKERYRRIGGRSPLLEITQRQARALEERLNSGSDEVPWRVYVGMKHWYPFIAEAWAQIVQDGVRQVVALALAPHYSRLSIGGYIQAVKAAQKKLDGPPEITFVGSWHDHPLFLRAVAEKIEKALQCFSDAIRDQVPVVFTAHSLPERILHENDPYPRELQETCEALASMLRLKHWSFAYQSAGHTPEPWLGPEVRPTLMKLCDDGHRHTLICPVGFVADHLEVLYDIDIECQELAKAEGIELRRTESLNTSPAFVEALAAIINEHLSI